MYTIKFTWKHFFIFLCLSSAFLFTEVELEVNLQNPLSKTEEVEISSFPIAKAEMIAGASKKHKEPTVTKPAKKEPKSSVKKTSYKKPVEKKESKSINKLLGSLNYPDEETRVYVAKYFYVAKKEQDLHGIPASVTLAQGLLESAKGKSNLAIKGNNHFGIKYYKTIKVPEHIKPHIAGRMITHDDCKKNHYWSDFKDQRATLVYEKNGRYRMCKKPDYFFKYKTAEGSYLHHSHVVKRGRYTKYRPKAFNDWAWAFKWDKGGYATSKTYHQDLIRMIKKIGLDRLDTI